LVLCGVAACGTPRAAPSAPLEAARPLGSIQQSIASGADHVSLVAGGASFDFRRIPPGVFPMGSPPTERGHHDTESPVRKVTISRPFYLGRTEVTQLQYETIMGQRRGYHRGDDLPVTQVQLFEVLAFCEKLTVMGGVVVTLPTSAQWEYACRAGTTTRFYSGDDEDGLERIAWYRRNAGGGPRPVGTKAPNAFGLHDMLGNVWEYCRDDLDLATAGDKDPVGVVSDMITSMRGGGWSDPAEELRCASTGLTSDWNGSIGFRIAIELPAAVPSR
jgi:formylglycine-generating enzyme required for sulfatase activity